MKLPKTTTIRKDGAIVINDRYAIYKDGFISDEIKGQDIPQWVFKVRDLIQEDRNS